MTTERFEDFVPAATEQNKRPAVILVFAILTFVGSGFTLLFSLGMLAPAEQVDFVFPAWIGLGTFFLTAGKIVGAAFMIPMKKMGFWLYTSCEMGLIGIWFAALAPLKELCHALGEINYEGKGAQYHEMAGMVYVLPAMMLPFSIAWIAVYGSQINKMK